MNKNYLEIIHQMTGTKITFCYGKKTYSKYLKKNYNCTEEIVQDGITTVVTNSNNGSFNIVIGVKKLKDIYNLKGLIVHELSHAVNELMQHHGFNCDEVRSYTLQFLYLEIMPFLDEKINEKQKEN